MQAKTNPLRVSLGMRPGPIKHTVQARLIDGKEAVIDVEYRYRTRTEFGSLMDDLVKEPPAEPAAVPVDPPVDEAEQAPVLLQGFDMQRLSIKATADFLLQILHSWGLDVPLTQANAEALCDEQPAVARAILADYRMAITEGRLGN